MIENMRDDGVLEIFLQEEYEFEHMLGKFADETMYDKLATFDCDIYKPVKSLGMDPRDESLVLVKFRKGVFSKAMTDAAHAGLRAGATASQNRGIAAGPRLEKLNNREFVTKFQLEVLESMRNSVVSVTGSDPIDDVIERFPTEAARKEPNSRGWVWLNERVVEEEFDWDKWLERARTMDVLQRKAAADRLHSEFVSDTTYANQVNSGIAGYFDRYPRIPYCRETSYTANNKEQFMKAIPFIDAVSEQFRTLIPGRYLNQLQATKKIDKQFLIGDSVYTTITINKNFRTACHYDAGDLANGFGNIVALGNGISYKGANLVFPKYRVAVDLRPGDMLLFDPHELHGNTEMIPDAEGAERVTIVLYFREKMLGCEAKIIEDLRYKFIEHRRLNPNHPLQRERWNGVSEGMYFSEEWIDFLLMHGMNDYVQEHFGDKMNAVSLEDFL